MKNSNLRIRIVIILSLIISFCLLTALVVSGSFTVFENEVYITISRFITPAHTGIMIFITNMGSAAAIIIVTVALLALPFTRKQFGIPVAVNAVISAGATFILKHIIARERPDVLWLVAESGYAFPSGHTLNSTAMCMMILLITFRLTKSNNIRIPVLIVGIMLPFFIGISRIYLGVHNVGDVFAGWIIGITAALLTDTLFRHYKYLSSITDI